MPVTQGPVKLNYRDVPPLAQTSRVPVVLVNGLGLSGRFWFDVPERLAALGHRVIILDNRGTGESDKPRAPYALSQLAGDVARVLDDARIDRAYVCGISMGGMITQRFALDHGARTAGIVLLATTPGLPHATLPGPRALGRLVAMPLRREKSAARSLARMLLAPSRVQDAHILLANWRGAFALDPPPPNTMIAHFSAAARHYTGDALRTLRMPAHVATGDGDMLIPPQNSVTLARLIPGATLEVLPGGGHALMTTHPDVVERAIGRFAAAAQARTESGSAAA